VAAEPAAVPSVLIYGAGAVGSFLGAKLGSDCAVTMLTRPAMRRLISKDGLRLETPGGSSRVSVSTIAKIDDLTTKPDFVLLCVKAYSIAEALPDLERLSAQGAAIVTLQNGVGTEEFLGASDVIQSLIAASLTLSVSHDNSVVRQETARGGLSLAPVNDAGAQIDTLQTIFERARIPVLRCPDARQMKWSKLLINILGNATSAILAIEPGAIFADPALFRLERQAFIEALVVMAAQGLTPQALPGFNIPLICQAMRLPEWLSRRLVGPRVAKGRGDKRPSLWLDLDNQRGQTEVDWLNGAVVRAAGLLGIPTPVNRTLTRLVTDLATNPAERATYAGHPTALLQAVHGQ
jgi:2-dehydropantoate 2-reductase